MSTRSKKIDPTLEAIKTLKDYVLDVLRENNHLRKLLNKCSKKIDKETDIREAELCKELNVENIDLFKVGTRSDKVFCDLSWWLEEEIDSWETHDPEID